MAGFSSFKHIDWKTQIFPKRDDLPEDLTAIDWIKTLAVVLMVIDHIGFYLFPDILWFRAVGRACVPLWFFLVGYARRQDLPERWLWAGMILVVANALTLLPMMPLNVLFSMALCRLCVGPLWTLMTRQHYYMWWIVLLLLFAGPATDLVIEYGTFGLLLAMAGYAMRRRKAMRAAFGFDPADRLFGIVLAALTVYEWAKFGFSALQGAVMAAGMAGAGLVVWTFKPRVLAGTAHHAQAPLVRFLGRYTLEIYVIHLLILKTVFGLQMLAARLIG